MAIYSLQIMQSLGLKKIMKNKNKPAYIKG